MSPEENQYQAGLSFTISSKKDVDFIGKQALEKIKKEKIKSRFAMFVLKESDPGKPLLLHDEPIYIEDKLVGRSTSANYSFNYKKNLVFGYIENDLTNEELQSKNLFIEVEKKKYSASIILKPLNEKNILLSLKLHALELKNLLIWSENWWEFLDIDFDRFSVSDRAK